jgi:hypothetical protein
MKLRTCAFVASILLSAALLTAQTGRITVRMSPAPNQTLRQHMTIAMTMATEPDATADAAPSRSGRSMPPQQLSTTTTMDVTTVVGPTDDRGYYDARVVTDGAAVTMTLSGKPAPAAMERAGGLAMIFHYDDQGQVIGIDPGSPDPAAVAMTQAMGGILMTVAPISLSVGETVTVPTQVKLPMPGTPATMSMDAETHYTLTSITFDGADRIAHLTVKMTVATHQGLAGGSQPFAAFDMRTAGEGRMDVNVDRGIVLHNELRSTIDSASHLSPTAAMMPNLTVHGSVTVTADFVK